MVEKPVFQPFWNTRTFYVFQNFIERKTVDLEVQKSFIKVSEPIKRGEKLRALWFVGKF
jgi:hypothetical protein